MTDTASHKSGDRPDCLDTASRWADICIGYTAPIKPVVLCDCGAVCWSIKTLRYVVILFWRTAVQFYHVVKSSLFSLTILCFHPAIAQDWLDEVVVTATGTPTLRERLGSSVTVITADAIELHQYRRLDQALRSVPGLSVMPSGGVGQQTSVFMRGANSNHTLVLLDGVPISDPSSPTGAVDFARLSLDHIERIEIVRGPQSTLYGSSAIGGVIHLISRKGQGKPSLDLKAEVGSRRYFRQSVDVSGGEQGFDYSAALGYYRTDGDSATPERLRDGVASENDSVRDGSASSQLNWRMNEQLALKLLGRYDRIETELDPEIMQYGFGTTEDSDAELEQRSYLLHSEMQWMPSVDWDNRLTVSYNHHQRENRNERQDPMTETLDLSHYRGDRLRFGLKTDWLALKQHIVTLGAEGQRESANANGYADYAGYLIDQQTDADARSWAVYLQDQLQWNQQWFATLGMRLDGHEEFGTEPTFRLTTVYQLPATDSRLTATVGTGFRAPSLEELYGFAPSNFGTVYRGNPDLRPEKSLGWEFGFEHRLPQPALLLGAHYFQSRIDDLIEVVYLANFDSTSVNIEQAEIWGIEAFAEMQLQSDWLFNLNYTYTHTEDESGAQLLRRPRHQVNLDVRWTPVSTWDFSLAGHYQAGNEDIDRVTGAQIKTEDYALFDLTVNYHLAQDLTLFGRIENLTNQDYEPVDGFQGLGRGFFLGINKLFAL